MFRVLAGGAFVGMVGWTVRFLRNVWTGRETGPPVDRTKHEFHGHY